MSSVSTTLALWLVVATASVRFEDAAAAMTDEEKVANEARERLGKDVPLAKGRHDVMRDGILIVTQTVV